MYRRQFPLLLMASVLSAENWTRFRGPGGSGISNSDGFPVEFNRKTNVAWRTLVRPGKSSPVLTARHVFLTSFAGGKLYTECYDRETGKLLWERFVERGSEQMANLLNHPAAITPVTDGENVYALFKDFGLVSYDSSGKLRWKAPLGPFSNTMGIGSSPVIAGDNVIVLADQVDGKSYIAAFDRRNGELRWKKSRDEGEGWGTPLVYKNLVLTASRGQIGAYTASAGDRILSEHNIATTIVASPILDGDNVYVFGYGSETPSPFDDRLKRLDKNQDGELSPDEYGKDAFVHGIGKFVGNRDSVVTRAEWDEKQREVLGPNRLSALRLERDSNKAIRLRELWRYDKNFTAVIPAALLYDGVLYIVRNGGILATFDAKAGAVLKTARLDGALGGYSASPVAAGGKLFFTSEEGKITVVQPGPDWTVLASNDIGEGCFATPALSAGQIYLRTDEALHRFEQTKK